MGAAVAEWLSSWLAEQEDQVLIPGLATWIFRDGLSPASKSRYGWKIAKSTLILKTTNQPGSASRTNTVFTYVIGLDLINSHAKFRSIRISRSWENVAESCYFWWLSGNSRTDIVTSLWSHWQPRATSIWVILAELPFLYFLLSYNWRLVVILG